MRIRASITALMVLGMAFCLSGTAYPTSNELKMKPLNQELQRKKVMQPNREKMHLQRKLLYPFAATILLTDDLTEKSAQSWQLEPGWYFTQEEGLTLLKGQGHYWARLEQGRDWSNYTLQARFKIIKGYVHFNALVGDNGRYIIGVGNRMVYLQKESPCGRIQGLDKKPAGLDPRGWHDIRIDIYRNHEAECQGFMISGDLMSMGSVKAFSAWEGYPALHPRGPGRRAGPCGFGGTPS